MSLNGASPLCDIVIPIWNQPVLTRRCLESLFRSTSEPVRLILIDNGSASETRTVLEQLQAPPGFDLQRIRNETNLGFIKAVNQGIRAGSAPWVCVLNNDTVVAGGWLTEMLKAGADPAVGLINPTSNSLGFHPGSLSIEEYAAGLKAQSGSWTELSAALGFCLLGSRSLFERIGLFDESFGMGYFEDDDLSRRAKAAGFKCVRACASYVYHEERASFQLLPGTEQAFQENRRRFEQRWGRRLRILWSLCGNGSAQKSFPVELVRQLVGQGHWITLVAPERSLPRGLASQAQVGCLGVKEASWRVQAILRLLLKRKKPFDLVISADPRWSRWIRRLQWLHRAQLLHSPGKEEILERCRRLSRFPS